MPEIKSILGISHNYFAKIFESNTKDGISIIYKDFFISREPLIISSNSPDSLVKSFNDWKFNTFNQIDAINSTFLYIPILYPKLPI